METLTQDHYEVLRVSRTAPIEVIHSAYRTLMQTLRKHPDLGGDAEEAVRINQAYEVLSNPTERARYDVGLTTAVPVVPQKKGEERRRAPRREVDATISYCVGHDDRWYTARVKDISTLGLRLLAREPIGKGLEIVIAGPNPVNQALHGHVRWSRMFHPSMFERVYEAGIEFEGSIPNIDQMFSF